MKQKETRRIRVTSTPLLTAEPPGTYAVVADEITLIRDPEGITEDRWRVNKDGSTWWSKTAAQARLRTLNDLGREVELKLGMTTLEAVVMRDTLRALAPCLREDSQAPIMKLYYNLTRLVGDPAA